MKTSNELLKMKPEVRSVLKNSNPLHWSKRKDGSVLIYNDSSVTFIKNTKNGIYIYKKPDNHVKTQTNRDYEFVKVTKENIENYKFPYGIEFPGEIPFKKIMYNFAISR